jgi:Na+:H+ antiporter, NhaA family
MSSSSSAQMPAANRAPIEILISPFARFAKMEAAGGILLLIATVIALVWANSPWEESYHGIWHTTFTLGIGKYVLSWSRHIWVNDGLMAIFFFLVGLEIKREVLIGELSSLRQAAFPFMAALGGSIVPALLYLALNHGDIHARGWGIPMATDIAFALGVLALLGNKVPSSLKVFVAALAIVDDIFGVLVIALFYTAHISYVSLLLGLLGVGVSFLANWAGVRQPAVYAFIGVFVWFAVLQSGVHATIAGVLLAFSIPVKSSIDKESFLSKCRRLLDRIEHADPNSVEAHAAIHALESQCEKVDTPLHRIEHSLQPWVSFLIMPVFAFSNAGVHVLGKIEAAVQNPVTLGVMLGLLLGKPLGIMSFAWLAHKTKLGAPPAGVEWRQIFGASWLCGIGFTMSLFIAGLALESDQIIDMAKIGTLAASVTAGVVGSLVLLGACRQAGAKAEAASV